MTIQEWAIHILSDMGTMLTFHVELDLEWSLIVS